MCVSSYQFVVDRGSFTINVKRNFFSPLLEEKCHYGLGSATFLSIYIICIHFYISFVPGCLNTPIVYQRCNNRDRRVVFFYNYPYYLSLGGITRVRNTKVMCVYRRLSVFSENHPNHPIVLVLLQMLKGSVTVRYIFVYCGFMSLFAKHLLGKDI